MTSAHDAHVGAVEHAKYAIGEVQEAISLVTDKAESAMGAVIMAVGQNPNDGPAQQAMNLTAEISNRTTELYNITEEIKESLDSYLASWQ